ncbi:Uma2 family endonuclease [Gloeothece verrucosa]|uniref:Putative restriction endonuclease domain-containing protein n=1 Tax=Gloeothece verrucosa (strain PCC 7822) TaxID=497965 RepID=E0UDL3_GLOV7|nr:Uma2 family endonuclease [Gloeothece verrucosa]ADN15326.1 protein of unknown function DUF820 [Gloeothece verrucosa PCC 7822]
MTSTNPTAPPKKLTFQEYLFYEDNTDTLYELYRGQLIPMAAPTGLHTNICKYLVYQFQLYFATVRNEFRTPANLPLIATSDAGIRTEIDSSRIPDIVVCSPQLWQQVCDRPGSGVFDFGETPNLVVEVTSDNWREDYIRKRAEYALIDIPEYWIVDANKKRVRILFNPQNEDGYEHIDYEVGQVINSPQLANLSLSVEEILDPPLVDDLIKAEQARLRELEQALEQERQRAERLSALLRERGIDPDSL